MVSPYFKFNTVSTVLFRKYEGSNVTVTNFMSKLSMFVLIKSTMNLANGNTGHAQIIGIILCRFPNCPIIYPVVPVYYCTGHPSNTISFVFFKFYIGSQSFTSELLDHCGFVDPQGCSWCNTP